MTTVNQFTAYLAASDRFADWLRALGTFTEETADFELHPTAELASMAAVAAGWSDEFVFSVTVHAPTDALWLVEFEPFSGDSCKVERYTDFTAAYIAATVALTPEHYQGNLTGILAPASKVMQALNGKGERVSVGTAVEWVPTHPEVRLGSKVVAS